MVDIPSSLQKRIADFLDEKCGKIDRYIEKQQKIIDKLTELWATGDTQKVAEGVLAFDYIWKEDLNKTVPGLTELVKKDLDLIQEKGMLEAVKTIL